MFGSALNVGGIIGGIITLILGIIILVWAQAHQYYYRDLANYRGDYSNYKFILVRYALNKMLPYLVTPMATSGFWPRSGYSLFV